MNKDSNGKQLRVGDVVRYDSTLDPNEETFGEVPDRNEGEEARVIELVGSNGARIQFVEGGPRIYKVGTGALEHVRSPEAPPPARKPAPPAPKTPKPKPEPKDEDQDEDQDA